MAVRVRASSFRVMERNMGLMSLISLMSLMGLMGLMGLMRVGVKVIRRRL